MPLEQSVSLQWADLLAETDGWLLWWFKLPWDVLLEIWKLLDWQLHRQKCRYSSIPSHVQVLTTVGFLATGTFQREIGDRSGVSPWSSSDYHPGI